MNERKDIYCDLGFWQDLSGKIASAKFLPDLEVCRRNQMLTDWYDLLCRSHVIFDSSIDDFNTIAKDDSYLFSIWKRSTDGRTQLDFSSGAIAAMCEGSARMERNMYNSLFLTHDDHQAHADKVGVISIDSNNLYNHAELFNDVGPAIKQSSKYNWSLILEEAKAKHNFNSMVIADNYIFKDVNVNLYSILDSLLPQNIEIVFYISVFSFNDASEEEITRRKKRLEEKIQELRPSMKKESLKVEVFGCSKDDFHDRGIVTNYSWIEIGAGFDLLRNDGKAKHSTNLHVTYPMVISEERMKCNREGYLNIISDAKKCLKSRNLFSNNRLLR